MILTHLIVFFRKLGLAVATLIPDAELEGVFDVSASMEGIFDGSQTLEGVFDTSASLEGVV